jgi:hypothetical protein
MMLDVESIGLYGDALAYGFVIFEDERTADGLLVFRTVEEGLAIANPDACAGERQDLAWINDHVFPWIDRMGALEFPKAGERSIVMNDPTTGVLTTLCDGPAELREAFWSVWERERARGTQLWADVCFPVETNFLAACVRARNGRKFQGPFPLRDVSTIGSGGQPERLASELPEHHPLMDSRLSARKLQQRLKNCA